LYTVFYLNKLNIRPRRGSDGPSPACTAEDRLRFQANPCEICGGQSDIGTGFIPSTDPAVLPCHYHSSYASKSHFIHLQSVIYNRAAEVT